MYSHNVYSSLLDIISGRKVARGVTGNVVINGEFIPENFRCASGYVTQVSTHICSHGFSYRNWNNEETGTHTPLTV